MDTFSLLSALDNLSVDFRNYKRLPGNIYNFSCPLCGDSTRNKLAARGYVYLFKGEPFYKCHNCAESLPLIAFIRRVSPETYATLQLDRFRDHESKPVQVDNIAPKSPDVITSIETFILPVSELPDDNEAKVYLRRRCLTDEQMADIFYVPDCRDLAYLSSSADRAFRNRKEPERRILLPYRNEKRELVGFSLRAIKEDSLRYLTLKMPGYEGDLVFGLDRLNTSQRIYFFEGQFDSLFVRNAVACGGTSLRPTLQSFPYTKKTVIFDNQPRNKDVVNIIEGIVNDGYEVCILPHEYQKDINGMIIDGQISRDFVKELIDTHTTSGLEAMLKFNMWRRV